MILAAVALAIVVQDRTALRAAPRSSATELTELWQGDVLEIRGERVGYLRVYNSRSERGGYLKSDAVRPVGLTEADAPELLAVLRFLRETPGSEALGISYGAAYLKAVPARALTSEPFDAIARMAERLADRASTNPSILTGAAPHLEVVQQFGIHMRTFERNGRMQVCYDGDLFRRVLSMPNASFEERAHAALALTRPDCIDPDLGPISRAALDDERSNLLDTLNEQGLNPLTRSRLRARRAGVWASVTYERARRGVPTSEAAQHALAELLAVHPEDLGDDRRSEYLDAVLRVAAIRWATLTLPTPATAQILRATPGDPGQTCITLEETRGGHAVPLTRRCTYGIVWMASAQPLPQAPAWVLAVQPLESWRELWVFRKKAANWTIDVLSPGTDDPDEGYVEFAGLTPNTRRLLIALEVKARGRFHRSFEELRLNDLAVIRQATAPDLLPDFGRWQDVTWRRDTLALH
jgi:hypothetical protein